MDLFLLALPIALILYILSRRKQGWSAPTKEDIDWAENHSDLIEKNS